MYDAGKIIPGLIIFLVLITFPVWYNVATGKADHVPDLKKPTKAEQCVDAAEKMRAEHMDLLNEWRDEVVRESDRSYVADDGKQYNKSLSNTCMDCHSDKAGFCDQCHDYLGVTPYCWDCHIEP